MRKKYPKITQRQPKVIFGGSVIDTLGLGHKAGKILFAKSTIGLIGGRGRGRGILSTLVGDNKIMHLCLIKKLGEEVRLGEVFSDPFLYTQTLISAYRNGLKIASPGFTSSPKNDKKID